MAFFRPLRLSRAPIAALASVGLVWGSLAAMLPQLKADLGLSDAGLGLALFMAAGGAMTAMATAPRFAEAFPKLALPLAGVLIALPILGIGANAGFVFFAASLILVGMTTGLLDILGNARIAMVEAAHDTGLMNLNHAGYSFVYAAIAALAGLARDAGWTAFAWFALVCVLCLALVPLMAMDRAEAVAENSRASQGRLPPVVWLLGAITLVAFFAENATESWSALHIERTLGQGAALGAMGPAMLGLTMGVGRLAGHFVTVRGDELRVIRIAVVIASCGLLLAAAAPVVWMAYLGFGLLGIGVSVIAPLTLALAGQAADEANRPRAVARTAMIGYAGFFFGPPLMGVLAELFGLRLALGFAGTVLLVVTLALLPMVTRGVARP